ncbi:MAG: L-fucose:H+ symporter permease [Aeoliella sp.]
MSNQNSHDDPSVVVPRQYLFPFILVTTLFALWGFANNLTDPMVKAFQEVFRLETWQSSLVQTAFYGGYATMAIPAALIIRKLSFKVGILCGLGLYALGALLFLPASMAMQFWLFLISLYVLTFGLAFLETAANPYILSMGPAETATRRLNLAQAFNPVGSILGATVAAQLVMPLLWVNEFRDNEFNTHPEYTEMMAADVDGKITATLDDFAASNPEQFSEKQSHDLGVIRTPYLIISLVVLGVFAMFVVTKMPNTGHSDDPIHLSEVIRNLSSFRYIGGVAAQTVYVGAQIMCWTFIIHYGVTLLKMAPARAATIQIGVLCLFIACRFLCWFVLHYISPGLLLGLLAVGGIITSLGTIVFENMYGFCCLIAISAFMSAMFPTIYGIALRGLSVDDAKLGSAGLIFAIVGGCFMPPLQGRIIDLKQVTFAGMEFNAVSFSFVLPLLCFVVIAVYGFITHIMQKPSAPS